MKKTYINPEMEVIKINAPQIMAGSPGFGGEFGGGTPESREFEDLEDFQNLLNGDLNTLLGM
ncbi:MAG: hypothetical protein IJV44_01835 [Prevotella sp.]|nr:hypothetical protein [Prevotella sp.]